MRLVLSFLEDERALSAMLSVVAHRSDSVFLSHLMARIGYEPPDAVVANLRRISSIPWIGGDMSVLDDLSDSHQYSAVQMVMHSGVKRLEAFQVIRHLMLHGKSGGRRAASDALKQFNGNDANEIALSVIDDDDPVVQANVVAQVRQRGIPGALTRLIEKVSSPHEVVREAARESLGEFNFQRYLASFEMMDEEVRASTGALVRSVDPNSVPLLRNELGVKSRTRRLRAIAVAAAIGAVEELETSLIERLDDEDHMVRAEAARVLAGCKTENARDALRSLLGDTSVIVQEAAER
jgi:HEAT repeat protein